MSMIRDWIPEPWPRILEANRDRIKKADLIYVGEKIIIPVE